MEEKKKQNLEFIEPEVKVVTITPQSRILQEVNSPQPPQELGGLTIQQYNNVL